LENRAYKGCRVYKGVLGLTRIAGSSGRAYKGCRVYKGVQGLQGGLPRVPRSSRKNNLVGCWKIGLGWRYRGREEQSEWYLL
jgi:hypothetical protein